MQRFQPAFHIHPCIHQRPIFCHHFCFMPIRRTKFYALIKSGEIKQPIHQSEKDEFWHKSYVKNKVEEYKPQT